MDNLTAHKASEYDQKVRQTIPSYETIHAEVLRLVKLVKPEVKCWVDTGCGTGRVAEQALRDFPDARFILADPSEAMLNTIEPGFFIDCEKEWWLVVQSRNTSMLVCCFVLTLACPSLQRLNTARIS